MIDDNENPEDTARREVLEETGYQLYDLNKVAGAYSSSGGITEFVHLFTASYSEEGKTGRGGGLATEGESIELVEMGFDEVREKLEQGGFLDVKTIILLQHFFMKSMIT